MGASYTWCRVRAPRDRHLAERVRGALRGHVTMRASGSRDRARWRHLIRLVKLHARYYNEDRPHMSLSGDAPAARAVEPIGSGRAIALPHFSLPSKGLLSASQTRVSWPLFVDPLMAPDDQGPKPSLTKVSRCHRSFGPAGIARSATRPKWSLPHTPLIGSSKMRVHAAMSIARPPCSPNRTKM